MKKALLSALAIVALASCSKRDELYVAGGSSTVSITSGITTRASGTNWESGDEIGVFMTPAADETEASNVLYTNSTDGATAAFSSLSPLIYPTSGTVDFLAYYPYSEDATAEVYAVDVKDQSYLPAIDLMTASKSDVAVKTTPVDLSFEHKLSNIVVTLVKGDGLTDVDDFDQFEVYLVGSYTETTYNITDDDFGDLSSLTNITLNGSGLVYEGIVIPQDATDVKLVFSHSTHGVFESAINNTSFESGYKYAYNATISEAGSNVELSGDTIEDWEDGVDDDNDDLTSSQVQDSFSTTYANESATLHYISSSADLILLSDMVNGNGQTATTYSGVTFFMTGDIDLDDEAFTSIGYKSGSLPFSGVFNGNGKKITGLNITATAANLGLFGYTYGATIKNLGLEGSVYSEAGGIGGIVGYADSSTIENCYNKASVESSGYGVGGVAGVCWGTTIKNCFNDATINGGSGNAVGGIAGNCSDAFYIFNCYNMGAVLTTGIKVGGIAGNSGANGSTSGSFENCYNVGAVSGSGDVSTVANQIGAVIGYGSDKSKITNCYYDSVTSNATLGISGADGLALTSTATGKDTEYMTGSDFVTALNDTAWAADTDSDNSGYPILTTINY